MSEQGLISKARTGLFWGGGFRLLQDVLQFALTLVLARLLLPSDYGIYAVVAAIVGFLNAASFDNFISYLLQVRDDEDVNVQDHFTAAVVLQSVLFLLTNLVAFGLRWLPDYANIAGYLHAFAPIILLSSIGGFHYRMLERALNWQRFKLLQSIGVVLTAVTVLTLAYLGAGVYALLLSPSIKYVPPIIDLLIVQRWRPTWEFSWQRYRAAFHFGLNRLASVAMLKGRVMLEANWLVLLAGLQTLGLLNRATALAQLIALQFATIVGQALYPVLRKIEPRTPKFQEASWLILHGMACALLPAACLLGLLAGPTVRTLFGPRWLTSGDYLPLVLASCTVAAMGQASYILLLSSAQQAKCLVYDALRFAALLVALGCLSAYGSIPVYLAALGVQELLLLFVLFGWLVQARAIEAKELMSALLPPILGSAIAVGVSWNLVSQGRAAGLFAPVNIGAALLFVFSYLLTLRLLFAAPLSRLVHVLPMSRRIRQLLWMRPTVVT